jgi:hypothetical protein
LLRKNSAPKQVRWPSERITAVRVILDHPIYQANVCDLSLGQKAVSARSRVTVLTAEEAPQPNVSLVVQQIAADVDCGISDNSQKWKLSTRENHRMFGKRKKS